MTSEPETAARKNHNDHRSVRNAVRDGGDSPAKQEHEADHPSRICEVLRMVSGKRVGERLTRGSITIQQIHVGVN